MIRLRAATIDDRTALIALLAEADMDYVDPPEDYVLAVEGETIAGCGRLEDHGYIVMLRPLVVSKSYRRRNVGRRILEGIMPADKNTGLVARGEAVAFYEALGFSLSDWDIIPPSQRAECETCPKRAGCNPQPMVHVTVSKKMNYP